MARLWVYLVLANGSVLSLSAEKLNESEAMRPSGVHCASCLNERATPFTAGASFLVWQSKEWGFEFVSKSFLGIDSEPGVTTYKQKLSVPDFSWSPGCKVDIGYRLPYDGWNLEGRWTYYHGDNTNLKKHFHVLTSPTGVGVVPLWHYPFIDILSSSNPLRFYSAAANWKLYFNSLDLDLGRGFNPTKSLAVRLFTGLKGTWIRQHNHVKYDESTLFDGVLQSHSVQSFNYLSSAMRHNDSSWGLGPRGGLDARWYFGWGFSLISEAGLSLLGSLFHLSTEYNDHLLNHTAAAELSETMRMKEHQWDVVPAFEGTIGLNWGACWSRTKPYVYTSLSMAYEVQYWWSQNRSKRNFALQAPGNMWGMRGDLQMHGLTASIRTDF